MNEKSKGRVMQEKSLAEIYFNRKTIAKTVKSDEHPAMVNFAMAIAADYWAKNRNKSLKKKFINEIGWFNLKEEFAKYLWTAFYLFGERIHGKKFTREVFNNEHEIPFIVSNELNRGIFSVFSKSTFSKTSLYETVFKKYVTTGMYDLEQFTKELIHLEVAQEEKELKKNISDEDRKKITEMMNTSLAEICINNKKFEFCLFDREDYPCKVRYSMAEAARFWSWAQKNNKLLDEKSIPLWFPRMVAREEEARYLWTAIFILGERLGKKITPNMFNSSWYQRSDLQKELNEDSSKSIFSRTSLHETVFKKYATEDTELEQYSKELAELFGEMRNNKEAEEEEKQAKKLFADVAKNGLMLKNASEKLRNNKNLALAAVAQNGNSLACASKKLQGDKEVIFVAVVRGGLALQDTSKEFQNDFKKISPLLSHLNVIKTKEQELRKRGHTQAAASALKLCDSLEKNCIHLISNAITKDDFKNKCGQAIQKARAELEKHRGWKQLLGYITRAIGYASAILINKAKTGNFLFFNKTDSATKIDKLERTLDEITALSKLDG